MTKKQERLIKRYLKNKAAGKAGYKASDANLDEYIASGGPIDELITLDDGNRALVFDQFKDAMKVSSGLSVRRYAVEVTTPEGVKVKD